MVKRNVREIIYFILILVLFYLAVKTISLWVNYAKINQELATIVVGIVYCLVMVSLYYLAGLHKCGEGFWDITPAALCRGGPYMWQGDSEQSKMCRDMAKTDKGRCAISSYNCPTGYNGIPRIPFEYTPLSDDSWNNARCEDDKTAPCNDVGLCGFEKQPYEGSYPSCK